MQSTIWAKNTSQSSFPTLPCIWSSRSSRSPWGYLFDHLYCHFSMYCMVGGFFVRKIRGPGHKASFCNPCLCILFFWLFKELFWSVSVEKCCSNDWRHLSISIICCVHYFLAWLKIIPSKWLKCRTGLILIPKPKLILWWIGIRIFQSS